MPREKVHGTDGTDGSKARADSCLPHFLTCTPFPLPSVDDSNEITTSEFLAVLA